jgi:hypothetical protein
MNMGRNLRVLRSKKRLIHWLGLLTLDEACSQGRGWLRGEGGESPRVDPELSHASVRPYFLAVTDCQRLTESSAKLSCKAYKFAHKAEHKQACP